MLPLTAPTDAVAAADVRAAFAEGLTASSAARFLYARENGLDWEQATQAAAAGLADHYRVARPGARPVQPAGADR